MTDRAAILLDIELLLAILLDIELRGTVLAAEKTTHVGWPMLKTSENPPNAWAGPHLVDLC